VCGVRVLFFMARPREAALLEGVRQEEELYGDIVLLPSIWEHYHNITHQTLEILRFAAAEASATHVMKVGPLAF
jgi:Galactosyltransferase